MPLFDTPPVESEIPSVNLDDDEALWEKWSWEYLKSGTFLL